MSDVARYITVVPERWDNIAYKAYGVPYKVKELLAANPGVPKSVLVAPGTTINIPILDVSAANDTSNMPPWKR